MQKINKLKHRHITSFQIIILGFLSVILLGSLFLMLPIATKDGQITPFSSITSYSTQPIVNMTIMALIIVGGIGFLTWEDIKNNKWNFKKYRMQSKVILSVTALLMVLPTLYFFLF